MNVCMVVGVDDAVRVVLDAVKRFAAPDKLPPSERAGNMRRYGDVEVFFDMRDGHEGEAHFHFVTHDDIEISFNLDFKVLDREGIDQLARNIEDAIGQKRKQRGVSVLFHPAPRGAQ